jgi:HK97 gp10 family phage protein
MALRFEPDRAGMAALRVAVEGETVPRLTEAIADDAERYAPVLTGALRSSIHTEYEGDTGYVVAGDENVDYAVYPEMGTSVMRAQPYLRPAAYQRRTL